MRYVHQAIVLASVSVAASIVSCTAAQGDDDERVGFDAAFGPSSACPVLTRAGRCRVLWPTEVATLATGDLVLAAAGFPFGKEGWLSFGVRWGEERLAVARSLSRWTFEPSRSLPWANVKGATGTLVNGEPSIYFVARLTSPGLYVARVVDGDLASPAPVTIEGTGVAPTWPQAASLADGRVLLAFVEAQRGVFVGASDSAGTSFRMREVALLEPSERGVLAHVGVTAHGTWVLSYQVADESWRFQSRVLVSRDQGASWSAAETIPSFGYEDVADPVPIARRDSGADVYYVRGVGRARTIRRRPLGEDGLLGAEQIVTSEEIGACESPLVHRLSDGRPAMTFTIDRGPARGDLAFAVLDGDAPR